MRQEKPKVFKSSNAQTASNGNYDVTIDFSKGPRGIVTVGTRPPSSNWPKGTAPKHNPHIWQASKKKP